MAGHALGQQVDYPKVYDPSVLVSLPRAANRQALDLKGEALPFVGADDWNAYELSWLNERGLPQVARGRFVVPCSSEYLIESKSLKLYLNSLNQHRFVDSAALCETLGADLSAAAGAHVQVVVQPFTGMREVLEAPEGLCLDRQDIACEHFEPVPGLLALADADEGFEALVDEVLYTDLFRSLCPVTGQPDWASVVICYQGPAIDHAALLRYLVSFREHRDFHENCVERIFCDISRSCRPQGLSVEANFLRRGGLDINPVRSSSDTVSHFQLPRYNRQ
ncbi:MAG TPA: NADPH-dependent 7-cyano-7-deazaguanine reductase QueF [Pseudomonadaceae bacterium]|nr:NADPH-dependent 7-cyano-7-deazaguanine reductase QueF [Pseudomonadaceae bacterium]